MSFPLRSQRLIFLWVTELVDGNPSDGTRWKCSAPPPSFKGDSKGISVTRFQYVTALKWFKMGPRDQLL
jgi:hypothetical protein